MQEGNASADFMSLLSFGNDTCLCEKHGNIAQRMLCLQFWDMKIPRNDGYEKGQIWKGFYEFH